MVSKPGDQGNSSCGGSAVMIMPWFVGSVESKTEIKHPQIHYYRNLASRTYSFAVGDSDGMAMYNGPHPVSKLSQTFRFPALERKEGPGKHGLKSDVNEYGLAGVDSLDRDAWRAGFDIARCCQPHGMRNGQQLNLRWMDGWMDGE